MSKHNDENLAAEADAFDRVALERLEHGLVPDLMRLKSCDWFYNNLWRRPYLIQKECLRNLKFALSNFVGKSVLEIGSGMGHMSLEIARNGYDVIGLELSHEAVKIARKTACNTDQVEGMGSLEYVNADLFSWDTGHVFDNICFFMAMHHFPDLSKLLEKVESMMRPSGMLIVVEPCRDQWQMQDAAVAALIRLLLASQGAWYEKIEMPQSDKEMEAYVAECLREYRDAHDTPGETQSPNDNASWGGQMLEALRGRFTEVSLMPGFSSFYKIGGGIRNPDGSEEKVQQVAEMLHVFDQFAVKRGYLHPSDFLWAGRVGIL